MSGESILTVSAAVVLLVQLVKWSGLPPKLSPLAVLVTSLVGVAFWAWTQDNFARQTAFDYFAGFVSVAAAAAGVFGFVREGSEAVASMRKGTGNGVPLLLLALLLTGSLAACASAERFNRMAADVTHAAIVASEQNRCTVHPAPCLSDQQFKDVNLELYQVSVAGREFTKLQIAGTASTKDVHTFLATVATTTAALSRAFPDGSVGSVLAELTKLQQRAVKLLGS